MTPYSGRLIPHRSVPQKIVHPAEATKVNIDPRELFPSLTLGIAVTTRNQSLGWARAAYPIQDCAMSLEIQGS
jgi:hypothetical protein